MKEMKKTYLLILSCFLFFACKSQSNIQIVNEFIQSYNDKDSLKTFNSLHKDFIELWEKDTVINSKLDYCKNYSWGKIMNDSEKIQITNNNANSVVTISTYYSDRDKLMGINPYKSKRIYEISDGKISRITGGEFSDYQKYDKPRREKYQRFTEWLTKNYELELSDFSFDKKGAEKLRKILLEYKRK
jgi:hypothetical protein